MSETTHGVEICFGKHKGERLTRVPVTYLKWMVNENTQQSELATEELKRRNHKIPEVELSPHAIDNASLRCRKIWHLTKRKGEGIYTWLCRVTLEALEKGKRIESEKYSYLGMKLVIKHGAEFPVLITIMSASRTTLEQTEGEGDE